MILTKNIKVGICFNNINHYKQYFDNLKIGDKIEIPIEKLSPGSHLKILSKCDICGVEKNIPYRDYLNSFNNGNYFCCNKCALEKRRKTKLEKYNDAGYHNIEKMKKTNLEIYGFENVFQNEDIKDKIKETCYKKYKVKFTSQTNIVKEKTKETCYKKYKYHHHLKNVEILNKLYSTNLERYKNKFYLKSTIYKNKRVNFLLENYNLNVINFDKSVYTIKCDICNKEYNIKNSLMLQRILYKTKMCVLCNPINSYCESGKENQLSNFIKSFCDNIILNDRHLIKELDIYLPNLKLAFEFNGIYWHSELNVDKNYHLNKTELCEQHGIHLIHIYEDDWIYKQEIVKSKILDLLDKIPNKIYARKCEIREIIDNKLIYCFLEENHLQGFIDSQIKLGLFYNDELVSLMIFSEQPDGIYEMFRVCNKNYISVIGGFNKLFKYFVEKYKPKEIISYVDRSWSKGDLYYKLGFTYISKTSPNYYCVIDGKKSNGDIIDERKNYHIYDSGNLKFVYFI